MHENTETTAPRQQDTRRLFRSYAWPAMLNMAVMALYNVTDRIFIGHGAGAMAICGLALTLPFVSLLGTVGTLTGVGSAGRITAAVQQRNRSLGCRVLGSALTLNLGVTLLLVLFSLCNLDLILTAFGGSETSVPYARSYMAVMLPASLLMNLNFTLANAVRAAGHPLRAMAVTSAGVVANILLDPLFIFGFGLGIEGAAWATLLSMCLSSVLLWLHFRSRRNPLKLQAADFRPQLLTVVSVIGTGMSAFIMNITTGMVNIIMNRFLESSGGDHAIGAYGIISSYSVLISMLLMGICQGMQPLLAQHFSRGDRYLTRYTLRTALKNGTLVAGLGFLVAEAGAPWLVKAFTADGKLLEISEWGLRLSFLGMGLTALQAVATTWLQTVRQAPKAICMNISRQFVFLVPALGFFSCRWGLDGIWLAVPFADLMTTGIALLLLRGTRQYA